MQYIIFNTIYMYIKLGFTLHVQLHFKPFNILCPSYFLLFSFPNSPNNKENDNEFGELERKNKRKCKKK